MKLLHIANKNYSSWSLRPWVLLTELGIPFEEKIRPFSSGSNYQDFRSFSPTGTVPCLVEGDQLAWDSLAIMEYLADQDSRVWPDSQDARNWARCAAAEMHSGFTALRNECPMSCGIKANMREISPGLQKNIDRLSELWEQGLSQFKGPFLAGDRFTAVDAFYAPVVFRINSFQLPVSTAAKAYAKHMLNLTSMQNWYNAAIKETWREVGHEDDVANHAQVIEDRRAS